MGLTLACVFVAVWILRGVWRTTGCIMDVNDIFTVIQFKQLDDKEKRKGRGG